MAKRNTKDKRRRQTKAELEAAISELGAILLQEVMNTPNASVTIGTGTANHPQTGVMYQLQLSLVPVTKESWIEPDSVRVDRLPDTTGMSEPFFRPQHGEA